MIKHMIKHIMSMTFALALVAAAYSDTPAHGGEHRKLMGTIASISQTEVVVVDNHQEKHVVKLGPATQYVKTSGEASLRENLGEGMRVVVTFASDGTEAAELRFASVGADSDREIHGDEHERGHGHDD